MDEPNELIPFDSLFARPASETASLQLELLATIPDNGLALEWMSPRTIATTDLNWKKHPSFQHEAWLSFLAEVGWVGALLYNRITGHLLDGHMRLKDALEQNFDRLPVLVVSLDEPTEMKVLALLDRIGSLYETKKAMAEKLSAMVETKAANLQALLSSSRFASWENSEDEEDGRASKKKKKKGLPDAGISLVLGERYDYVVLMFRTEINFNTACDHFGIEPVKCAFNSGIGKGRVVDGDAYLQKVIPQIGTFPQPTAVIPPEFNELRANSFVQSVLKDGEVSPT